MPDLDLCTCPAAAENQANIVRELEAFLSDAREGKLTALALVAIDAEHASRLSLIGVSKYSTTLLGALEEAKFDLVLAQDDDG